MRVGIVGAGVAGLALANHLRRKGIEAEIFEKTSRLEPIGAGFTIQPTGLQVLEQIVNTESILATAALVDQSRMMDVYGNPLAVDVMESLSSGAKSYSIYRGDVHDALLKNLDDGGAVKTSMKATKVDSDKSSARIQFEDGTERCFDLVVGADGIRSITRSFVSPEAELNQSHGAAIRTLVRRHSDDIGFHNFRAWMGRGKVVLAYPVKSGEFLNLACYVEELPQSDSSWSCPVDPGWLRTQFRDWDCTLTDLLGRATNCFSWSLADVEGLGNWHRERVVLIGDAAHAMVPYLGQGANQALADCHELANVLGQVVDRRKTLVEAIEHFERVRKPHVTQMQKLSRRAGYVFKSDFDGNKERKNREIKALLKEVAAVQGRKV